ncbi:hypothetical protein FAF44_00705 [Nonomuraea sp. MG754425]|uniref:hypothetical protein n=1 Tax=Nonomuraea sp. MG754425 TaxID=2570319 RepID=UPI001F489757|nr:hypothetical protein [Nonomuraea sp. MG754425]MCF6466935.1 hypothetical protein [Nonomuraea sp. MG754425]
MTTITRRAPYPSHLLDDLGDIEIVHDELATNWPAPRRWRARHFPTFHPPKTEPFLAKADSEVEGRKEILDGDCEILGVVPLSCAAPVNRGAGAVVHDTRVGEIRVGDPSPTAARLVEVEEEFDGGLLVWVQVGRSGAEAFSESANTKIVSPLSGPG